MTGSHEVSGSIPLISTTSSRTALVRDDFYALHQKSSLTRFVAPPLRNANASLVCISAFQLSDRSIVFNWHKTISSEPCSPDLPDRFCRRTDALFCVGMGKIFSRVFRCLSRKNPLFRPLSRAASENRESSAPDMSGAELLFAPRADIFRSWQAAPPQSCFA